jgi:hypothetical protein
VAVAERIVIVANPAKKRNAHMAMTLKQKLHFGSKRVRAAAKAAMKRKRTKKRAAAVSHRPRTKPNPAPKRRAASKARTKRRKSQRSNPADIISLTLGNPAKRRTKAVAKTKRRKKASAPRVNSAGRRRTKKNPGRRRAQRNPAGYGMRDLVALGGGAVLGASLPKLASQMVLGTKNTGFMGYLANLAGTGLLAFAASRFAPRERMLAAGILAGGVGQVISRAISDYTTVGQYLQSAGMGDYMASNWVTPQVLPNALESPMSSNGYQPQIPMSSSAANVNVSALTGVPLY